MRQAYGYLRVSGKGQIDGDGFERQREKILAFCAANDIEIVQWFEEKGISGTLEERPALQEMFVHLLNNGVRIFLIEKLDRLARDPMVQEHIIADCRKQEIEPISAEEPDLCKDDPTRKLLRVIMGAISEYDKTMIVLKLKAARQRKRLRGEKCEGAPRYGTRPGEDAIRSELEARRANGMSWQGIAAKMNNMGYRTRSGGKWYAATIQRMLQ